MAEQRCPRVDSRRSAKDLEQQIRNMELRIQQGASNSGNVDEITRRLEMDILFLNNPGCPIMGANMLKFALFKVP